MFTFLFIPFSEVPTFLINFAPNKDAQRESTKKSKWIEIKTKGANKIYKRIDAGKKVFLEREQITAPFERK